MGHYMTAIFEAKLNPVGFAIIETLYKTGDWRETAEFFTEYKFVERLSECRTRVIPFFAGPPGGTPSGFDPVSGVWNVRCEWKDHGEHIHEVLEQVLPYMISEPLRFYVDHELWEDYKTGKPRPRDVVLQPLPPPEPDWFRKYGD